MTSRLPQDQHVINASHTDRQSTYVVRADHPIHDPSWAVSELGLEDLVLAYLAPACSDSAPVREVLR